MSFIKYMISLLTITCSAFAGTAQTVDELKYELYLQQLEHVEKLITLGKYAEARELINRIDKLERNLEYDYLDQKLNQQDTAIQIHNGAASALAIHPTGDILATGGADSTIYLWDANSLQKIGILNDHEGAVTCLDFHPDTSWLMSGSRDKTVRIWDWKKEIPIKELKDSLWNAIYDVTFSPQGEHIVVTTWTFIQGKVQGVVDMFETETWNLIQKFESPSPHPVAAVDFSRDGKGLAYGTWGLSMHYYDLEQRNVKWALNMMDNHEYSSITSLEISPSNQ